MRRVKSMSRRLWIGLAAVTVVAIVAVAVWPGDREPEYQGKKLSEWLAMQHEHPAEAARAVRAIGTNAIPFLLRWADYRYPRWEVAVGNLYARHPNWVGAARFFARDD